MSEDQESIAKKSLRFLDEADENEWAAYPVSSLPYPKDVMRPAIMEYLKSHAAQMSHVEIQIIVYQYALLASFIDDDDAALVNSMALRHRHNMHHVDRIKKIELPQTLHGTPIFRHFLDVNDKMTLENQVLKGEIRSVLDPLS